MRKEDSLSLDYFFQEYPLLECTSLGAFLFSNTGKLIPCIAPGFNHGTHNFQQIGKFFKRLALLVFRQFLV